MGVVRHVAEQGVFLPAQRVLGNLYSQAVGRPWQSGLLKTFRRNGLYCEIVKMESWTPKAVFSILQEKSCGVAVVRS